MSCFFRLFLRIGCLQQVHSYFRDIAVNQNILMTLPFKIQTANSRKRESGTETVKRCEVVIYARSS
jgi:ABC-type lipopolysaccharide export system ATPase subunit